jgi:predicted RNase H-like HicB family nuclease
VKTNAYEATATRSGGWWSVEIPGVQGGIFTQGRNLADAERMAQDAISGVLGVPIESVAVRLRVVGVEKALAAVEAARRRREEAAQNERATLARASSALVELGLSQRDAARLLGLSHQRVNQLLRGEAA